MRADRAYVTKGADGWTAHCDACGLEPMKGLSYEGATVTRDAHNALNHTPIPVVEVHLDSAESSD
jgi:hypothetical protein